MTLTFPYYGMLPKTQKGDRPGKGGIMLKSYIWSLAMALATTMSGASSIDNVDDDDSKPEETTHLKPAKPAVKHQSDLPRYFLENEN